MDVMDALQEDIELLQDNLQMMQERWDLKEGTVDWRKAPLRYPFQWCKRFIRSVVKWIMRPYFQMQIEFNGAAVRAVGDLYRIQSNLMILQERTISGIAEGKEEILHSSAQINMRDVLPESDLPRVVQIVASLNFGDAVGNDVMAIKRALKEEGYITEIYATTIHKKIPEGIARKIYRLPELKENDIVIYHFAAEDPLVETIKKLACKKVLRYHNVTPPRFFHGFDSVAEKVTNAGLEQVKELRDYIDYVMTVSEFNKRDLENMGYRCPMYVVPILIQFDDYMQKPSEAVIRKYSDGVKNIIFVGRVAPNKKIEDVIEAFEYYYQNVDKNTRLIIVGSYNEKDKYYKYLKKRLGGFKGNNVIFTGHIAFDEILGYYKIADVFLCMSEHEGFCVPLVEAMYFKVPIVAYASTAVPDTLDGCGVLLEDKQPEVVANELERVLKNKGIIEEIINGQEKHLKDFDNTIIKGKMLNVFQEILKTKDISSL